MAWAIYKGTFILNPYLHICKKCLNGNPVKILQQTLSSCNKTKKLGFILKIWGSCLDKKHFFQTLDWNTTRPINMFPSLDLACYRSTIHCYVLLYFPHVNFKTLCELSCICSKVQLSWDGHKSLAHSVDITNLDADCAKILLPSQIS